MNVPEQYMQNMQTLLRDEFQAYAASFSMPSYRGLRLNTLRKDAKERCEGLPFLTERSLMWRTDTTWITRDSPRNTPMMRLACIICRNPLQCCLQTACR